MSHLWFVLGDYSLIGQHSANRRHHSARRPVLPGIESSLDEPNSNQDRRKRQISHCWRVAERFPGDEDQNTSDNKDATKATEEVSDDLSQKSRLRRRHLVLAVFLEAALDLVIGQSVIGFNGEAASKLVNGDGAVRGGTTSVFVSQLFRTYTLTDGLAIRESIG